MACSLVWVGRLFRHRPFTRLHSANPSTPPRAPASPTPSVLGTRPAASNLNAEYHPAAFNPDPNSSSNDVNDNLFLLNTMAGQGSSFIAIRTPYIHPDDPLAPTDPPFSNSEGYLGLRAVRPEMDGSYNWVYGFSTAAAASYALLHHPHIFIAGDRFNLFPYEADADLMIDPYAGASRPSQTRDASAPPPPPPSDISPPRKRLKKSPPPTKIVCKICFGDIDGAYATPCRRCKEAVCYECLKTQFKTAMRYIDRMPVMCCATVMHHEVARGILSAAEVEKYKQKYDESSTIDPLYCPVPTCSAFIPPRMFKQTDRTVTCHVCKTAICTKCRQHAKDEHVCANDDSRQFILQTYEYKICPKCGTGVMKMYGCPHIRCQCGAHWCWDCQRPMNACYQKPCRTARGEGEESDGGDFEPESDEEEDGNNAATSGPVSTEVNESMQVQAPQDQILLDDTIDTPEPTRNATPTQVVPPESAEVETIQNNENQTQTQTQTQTQASETAELASDPTEPEEPASGQPENLDDPDDIDWEGVSMDFGDEPTDETWDTWGCRHQFSEFAKDRVPKFWLVGVNPAEDRDLEVECMGCFTQVKVTDGEAKKTGFREKWCHRTSSQATEPSTSGAGAAVEVDRRTKKSASKPHASFECRSCGVIYCGPCKKAARQRMSRERVAPDSDPL